MAVTLTETAAREIAAFMKHKNLDPENTHLRVGVKGGGCSGFSYLLDLTESQKDSDEEWDFEFEIERNGQKESFKLKVICDPKSFLYLNGTVVDFRGDLMDGGFVFNNPNATATCGCGSSFGA